MVRHEDIRLSNWHPGVGVQGVQHYLGYRANSRLPWTAELNAANYPSIKLNHLNKQTVAKPKL